ncbi:type II toxin-antitoxin system VapB family antitoxin [Inquilinus sp.]|jgi:antitoxin VapB|uniref:type II toxin-antitoxin system VapB family antitoxin n=1 Tax=Inquilinus sp. TaxID=1932117 RepID=UPI0037832B5C
MAFSVKDDATDAAVRRLAELKQKTLTDTIREAVEIEYARTIGEVPLLERLRSIGDAYAAYPKTGDQANKAFFDDLSGDP